MKKNILKKAILPMMFGLGLLMVSCEDFLTIYPTNSVVLENYWKEKADVEGMVATCYKTMLSSSFVERAIVWGDLRSDNMILRTGSGNTALKYIIEANLLPTNSYCSWGEYYKTINYCNIVLKYAPDVVNEDPNFTVGDLTAVEGQMYALRALCQFYLVRAFRDVPLAREAMVDDSQPLIYPQVKPLEALDSIMLDLQTAEYKVMKSGSYIKSDYNKGYVTRDAVRAMMADVLLWKAAFIQNEQGTDSTTAAACYPLYDQCIVCCDSVINAMNQYQKELNSKSSSMVGGTEDESLNPYYLIQNSKLAGGELSSSAAYNSIFGSKNSSESIFELQFDGDNNANGAIPSLYGYSPTTGALQAAAFLGETSATDVCPFRKTDIRATSFLSSGTLDDAAEYSITKYAISSDGYRSEKNNTANWIIYRKTDVMLMKAEALALRNNDENDLVNAFALAKAVNQRSLKTDADSLLLGDYSSASGVLDLVLEERHRELMFEGKRWFDLVRKALRERSTTNILTLVVRKFDSNAGAVQSKMASLNTLFFPIAESEMNVNPLLVQNEAYEETSSIQKN